MNKIYQKPYYQDQSVIIYHGDCRQIVPQLGSFDLLLTDPPYGIGVDKSMNKKSGKHFKGSAAPCGTYKVTNWDNQPPSRWVFEMLLSVCKKSVMWGGNFFDVAPSKGWLVWDKLNGESDFSDCELAWTNLKTPIRKKEHLWNGMLRKNKEQRWHPTQKPVELMQWCINLAGDVQTILDPFAGSGTTGRAAKDLGKQAVLVEMDEQYCEIAAQRMAQEVLL